MKMSKCIVKIVLVGFFFINLMGAYGAGCDFQNPEYPLSGGPGLIPQNPVPGAGTCLQVDNNPYFMSVDRGEVMCCASSDGTMNGVYDLFHPMLPGQKLSSSEFVCIHDYTDSFQNPVQDVVGSRCHLKVDYKSRKVMSCDLDVEFMCSGCNLE